MKRKDAGLTLVELVTAITILGISMSAVVYWVLQGNRNYVNYLEQSQATELADLYLSEVLSTGKWDEQSFRLQSASGVIPTERASIGAEEASRMEYDDCDDYHGFTAARRHTFKNAQSMDERFAKFSVLIEVYFVDFTTLEAVGQPTDIKRIDVTVTWNNTQTVTLSALMTNA